MVYVILSDSPDKITYLVNLKKSKLKIFICIKKNIMLGIKIFEI